MLILVTGCCGTTGTSLVKYLLDNTEDMILGVDNFYKDGSRNNYLELSKYKDASKRFKFIEMDIISSNFYQKLREYGIRSDNKIDQIYNLAAIVETPRFYDAPYDTYRVNCQGAIELFEWACRNKVDKFVNASSSEIYGHSSVFPTKEDSLQVYDSVESSTRWSYAHGKILTEYVMNQISDRYDGRTKVCHLRYANVYGEHDLSPVHVIPYFLDRIIKNKKVRMNPDAGNIYRTFLNNDDSTLGTYLAMQNMVNKHAYNIGSQEEINISSLFNLCLVLCKKYGFDNFNAEIKYDIIRPGDPKRRRLDTSRAKEELGFSCQVSLEDGIKRMIERIIKEMKDDE